MHIKARAVFAAKTQECCNDFSTSTQYCLKESLREPTSISVSTARVLQVSPGVTPCTGKIAVPLSETDGSTRATDSLALADSLEPSSFFSLTKIFCTQRVSVSYHTLNRPLYMES